MVVKNAYNLQSLCEDGYRATLAGAPVMFRHEKLIDYQALTERVVNE